VKLHPLRLALLALALTAGALGLFALYVNDLEESYSGPHLLPTVVKVVAWLLLLGAVVAAVAAAGGTRGNGR
jgi:hypothetical protein